MAKLVPRIYSGFRGVDFRGDEVNLVRSPDSLNMWKDYNTTDSIRTRPAMALVQAFPWEGGHFDSGEGETVYGISFFKGAMIVHVGEKLISVSDGERLLLYDGAAASKSSSFVFDDVWYFKDGTHYLRIADDGQSASEVVGYIPTTSIARKPAGGGTVYEDVNMLSDFRINTFLADGESTDFYLDATDLDEDDSPCVTVNGERIDASLFDVDYTGGRISFHTAPPAPDTDGQDNVSIRFKRSVPGYRDAILHCRQLQVFDNRVFFSGNSDRPNAVWHCSLNDPTYCSDLDVYPDGMDSAAVRGMVAGNNALWVFREPSDANTTVFYHTPTIDDDYGKIYPSTHSSVTTGCVGKAINFGDDIVFFSTRGMEGISGDITTEQALAHRSSTVDSRLVSEAGYADMVLAEWEGYLLVFIGDRVYLADSRTAFRAENHYEYEWFYWKMEKAVTCTCVHDGILYLGTVGGVYTLTDYEAPLVSYWVTPKDKFVYPHKLKTTNKRGCVAEATGDIKVYAKVEDGDFDLVGRFDGVTDYFVSRIKRKKFKDIQLKFYSDTRFSLETVTLECFVGGYVKR